MHATKPGDSRAAPALPVLETARLRLRPRTLDDLEDCFRLDREPGTIRWVDWPLAAGSWDDEAAHRAFIRSRTLHPYPPGLGYWIVARRAQPDEFLLGPFSHADRQAK